MSIELLISLISVIIAIWAAINSELNLRRGLAFNLHESFVDIESSARRAKLHMSYRQFGEDWYIKVSDQDKVMINSALAQLDNLAYQSAKGNIPRLEAELMWGRAMKICWERSKEYAKYRSESEGGRPWYWLQDFVENPPPNNPVKRFFWKKTHYRSILKIFIAGNKI